jgi:hypothetical protein
MASLRNHCEFAIHVRSRYWHLVYSPRRV